MVYLRDALRDASVFLLAGMMLLLHFSYIANAEQPARQQVNSDRKTIRDFGAIGDGVADETDAIQRAVDSRIGSVRFPKGKYRITKTIVVDLDLVGPTSLVGDGTPQVIMEGAGPAFRLVGTHSGTAAPHTVKDNVWENQRTPMIDGIEIVGAHDLACGIEADGTMQLTITRVVVRKAWHGIHLVNRNRNVVLSDCHLYENRGAGVFYDNVNLHQSNIVGCHISYNEQGGVVIRGGDVRNVHIGTCDIEGNMGGKESQPAANVLLVSEEGSIGEVAIVGCTIQHTHGAPDSANIRIDAHSKLREFTPERRHGNITIANNILSDVQYNVDIKNARGVTITGNTIWKGYTANVRVANSRSIVMSDNVFDRNPRYSYGDGAAAKQAIIFDQCNGCTINANHIDGAVGGDGDGGAALVIRNSHRFNVTDCTIVDCGSCGILLDDVSRSRVSDCLIDHRDDAADQSVSIRARGGQGNQISDNLLGHGRQLSEGFTEITSD
ncbi:right-handed parallel beta-helix repeat-containing protein [Allorhodopirellula solitaria]|uniref:Pectate lyase superfamily protein n=1 Tax=Allorhodopirellula solitaria TaxID=2527987 RepID=A0A5C5YB08_9BACT|nr:right-handed parallel beta-helix repeat-containing protein [Allorhodopirellula solitaria]TWT72896.1 Pectate lyase superfamily protein [Allorhodopirellula solitaria]